MLPIRESSGRQSYQHALIAEDDPDLCDVYHRLLGHHLSIDTVASISELRSKIDMAIASYDLFVIDLLLKDGSLLDLDEEDPLFSHLKQTPSIVVSQIDDMPALMSCTNKWAKDYITKPFNNNELVYRCLRRVRRDFPEVDLDTMRIRYNTLDSEPLTMLELKLFRLLERAEHEDLNKSQVALELHGHASRLSQVEVSFSRLRRKLATIGFTIATRPDNPNKVRISKL